MRRLAKAPSAGSISGSGDSRGLLGLACLCVLGLAAFLGSGASAASADSCPNAAIRAEQGASNLAECRAYEMVSPVAKGGNAIKGAVEAAPDGNAVAYQSNGAFAGAASSTLGGYYVGRRSAQGWSVDPLEGAQNSLGGGIFFPSIQVSEDLTSTVQFSSVALAPGAVEGNGNVYLRNNLTGTRTLLATTPEMTRLQIDLVGPLAPVTDATPDLSHVVFNSLAQLVPDAPHDLSEGGPPNNAYEVTNGEVRLINRLPNGTPLRNGRLAALSAPRAHIISADGRRIFFGGGSNTPLYVREDGQTTVPLSVSQRTGEVGEVKPGEFVGASKDGSVVFFSSSDRLTDEDQSGLYRLDLDTDELTVVSKVLPEDPFGFGYVFGPVEISEDGSTIYFSALNDLTGGGQFFGGNLYMWHAGALALVGVASGLGGPTDITVSPNGRYLGFATDASLTGYDNGGFTSAYMWDRDTKQLSCVSCGQPGDVAPARVVSEGAGASDHIARAVLNDGRIFFSTAAALVPEDVNGRQDVYQWKNGVTTLISTGRGSADALFQDATPDGQSVFFTTAGQLVGIDVDGDADLYDARVDGGLSSQSAPPPKSICEGEACHGPASEAPKVAESASSTFSGPGNASKGRKPPKASKRCKKGSKPSKKCAPSKRKHRSSSSKSRGSK